MAAMLVPIAMRIGAALACDWVHQGVHIRLSAAAVSLSQRRQF